MAETEREVVRVAPKMQLPRTVFVGLFVAMIGVGLAVYATFPESVGGPPLPVEVKLDTASVPTKSGELSVLADVIRIRNPSQAAIGNLWIELNGQYVMTEANPLAAGKTLELPLSVFTDKRSSQRFNPKRHAVTEVVVAGQLPSRARGMSKFEFAE